MLPQRPPSAMHDYRTMYRSTDGYVMTCVIAPPRRHMTPMASATDRDVGNPWAIATYDADRALALRVSNPCTPTLFACGPVGWLSNPLKLAETLAAQGQSGSAALVGASKLPETGSSDFTGV